MAKRSRPIDIYVAAIEAQYGNFKSNRTLVAELAGKEREQERVFYKEIARVVSALREKWDQEKHAALGKKEYKFISFEPTLIIYADGSKQFSCRVSLSHIDLSLIGSDTNWLLLSEAYPITAPSFNEFKQLIAETYGRFLSYAQE